MLINKQLQSYHFDFCYVIYFCLTYLGSISKVEPSNYITLVLTSFMFWIRRGRYYSYANNFLPYALEKILLSTSIALGGISKSIN